MIKHSCSDADCTVGKRKKKKRTFLFSCWLLKLFLIIARKAGYKSRCRRLKGDLGLSPKERILDKDFKGFQWLWWQVFPFLTESPAPLVKTTWTVLSAAPNPCTVSLSRCSSPQVSSVLRCALCPGPSQTVSGVLGSLVAQTLHAAQRWDYSTKTQWWLSHLPTLTSSQARLLQGDAYLSVDCGV